MPRARASSPPPPAAAVSDQDRAITAGLLGWYDRHRRRLPWRALPGETPDPYAVWLSEVMLQQTTVQAVKPYYTRFLERWPTVSDLAAASDDAVMQAWAGLGYYSRARNLLACARAVEAGHGGRFPGREADLRGLPGIGAYTAAAIAAIAFGEAATVVDGNVERVMARLHAVEQPLPGARGAVAAHMAAATPGDRPGDFAQAVMDLGATLCTPRNPACTICPVRPHCRAAAAGIQANLPRKAPKAKTVQRHGTAVFIVNAAGEVLVRTRPPRGLLGGTVDLPGSEWGLVDAEPGPAAPAPGERYAGRVTHTFTHFTLYLDVMTRAGSVSEDWPDTHRWVADARLDAEALSTLARNTVARGRGALADAPLTRPDRPSGSRKRRSS